MGDLINLRRARKEKARDEKAKTADANRVTHGTPKVDRDLARARAAKAAHDLESHKKD